MMPRYPRIIAGYGIIPYGGRKQKEKREGVPTFALLKILQPVSA
jgi:hypothetical protein